MILMNRFNEAGLTLEILDKPFAGTIRGRVTGAEIFQMDIRRKFKANARSEYFVIYIPEGTVAHVDHVSKEWHQLVLSVKEPVRNFEEDLGKAPNWGTFKGKEEAWIEDIIKRARITRSDVIKRDGHWFAKRKTTSNTRHILLGEDERQMFMCMLPKRAATVTEAHQMLKAPQVAFAEGKQQVQRQGEWFFLKATSAEVATIENGVKKNTLHIKKNIRVEGVPRAPGKPHTADELIQIPGTVLEHGNSVRQMETFIRGSVKHSDHKTLKFLEWRKVIRNAEPRPETRSIAGGTWID